MQGPRAVCPSRPLPRVHRLLFASSPAGNWCLMAGPPPRVAVEPAVYGMPGNPPGLPRAARFPGGSRRGVPAAFLVCGGVCVRFSGCAVVRGGVQGRESRSAASRRLRTISPPRSRTPAPSPSVGARSGPPGALARSGCQGCWRGGAATDLQGPDWCNDAALLRRWRNSIPNSVPGYPPALPSAPRPHVGRPPPSGLWAGSGGPPRSVPHPPQGIRHGCVTGRP